MAYPVKKISDLMYSQDFEFTRPKSTMNNIVDENVFDEISFLW